MMVGMSKPEVPVEVAEQLDAAIRFSEAADLVAKQAESRRREALPELVLALVPTLRSLGDPQASQYQLDVLPADLKALPAGDDQ